MRAAADITPALQLRPYDLPDAGLLQPVDLPGRCVTFVPPETAVVIGKGSDPEQEVDRDAVLVDGIPVMRRTSGGCAVVISPEMLAISFAMYGQPQRKSGDYFRDFNALIIAALGAMGVRDLTHAGTSDISLHGRKVAGTAIYRSRQVVFYHAILNLRGDPAVIARYLKLPPRMPVYRENRAHADFVTSLAAAGCAVDPANLSRAIYELFNKYLEARAANPAAG